MISERRAHRGFALVTVLVLLVVLTLVAGTVAMYADKAVSLARHEQDAFTAQLDMASTRDTLLFLLSTQPQTVAGLVMDGSQAPPPTADESNDSMPDVMPVGNELRLDDRPYAGLGQTLFSFQDDRGLISVNWGGSAIQAALLQSLGAQALQIPDYADKLADYQDADDLRRLNGGEAPEYVNTGLPPPANQPLSSPLELRRVLGWNQLLKDKDDAWILHTLTMARTVDFNVNTAPAHVLSLLPGLDAVNAQRMVELRGRAPFTSLFALRQQFPLQAVAEEGLTLFSNRSGNITLWDRTTGARYLQHWTLSTLPNGLPPWHLDFEIRLPRDDPATQANFSTPATSLFTAPAAADG